MLNNIFQFIAVSNSGSLYKIVKGSSDTKVIIVFDVEDGVQDVINPSNTQQLKQIARQKLFSEIQNNAFQLNNNQFGIRINSLCTNEFKHDLKFLIEASKMIHWRCIVVPKINSKDEINHYFKTFHENNISFTELIPIIETVQGFNSLSEIFSNLPTEKFHRAFWGHHDYNLDAGHFPFIEQASGKYWKLTKQLIRALEKRGFGFGGGVFTELNNDQFLIKIISMLASVCTLDFGFAALGFRQAKVLSSINGIAPLPYLDLPAENEMTDDDKIHFAEETIELFKKNQLEERSFSIIQSDRKLISPQQYIAASKFLTAAKIKND